MDELKALFLLVCEVCENGECYDMTGIADDDRLRYGAKLQELYQKAIGVEPGYSWRQGADIIG